LYRAKLDMAEPIVLAPARLLSEDLRAPKSTPPSLLILNQPISDFTVFARLWKNTKYHICADGGANRLHDMFEGELEAQRADYVRRVPLHALPLLMSTSYRVTFTETSILCVMTCARTMRIVELKYPRIVTSIAPTSAKP
jgi:hypothetical protein